MISSASLQEHFGARRTRSDAQLLATDDAWPLDMLASSASPARRLKTFAGDVLMIGGGWVLLIGIVVYPQAQIVGIAACAIALIFARKR